MKNKELAIFINSVIFTIAFISPVILQRFMQYQMLGPDLFFSILFDIIIAILFIFPLLYICSVSKILLFLIYLISGVVTYFIYQFNITINADIIAAFFETNLDEIKSFLSINFMLVLIGSALLCWLCAWSLKAAKVDKNNHNKIIFICFAFVLSCLLGYGEMAITPVTYKVIKQTGLYWLNKVIKLDHRIDISQEYEYQIEDKSNDLNIILIIGESARGDHFSLGGYARDTNPLLSKEKNLIYYRNVTACYPLTRIAVPCMVTRATRDNRDISARETSFISVFKKLGFYTSWLGMQGVPVSIDASYLDLVNEADKALLPDAELSFMSRNDSNLLPFIEQFYQQQKRANLLVVHSIGSHFDYDDRYLEEFRKFEPTCAAKKFGFMKSNSAPNELINSYDNSILHTDYFIKMIIDQLRDKNALLIYTSDHGESLGEHGRFFHGSHNADEQVAVQMIFWASDKYIKAYPENYAQLVKLQNKAILHDHLFHSILGCSGVKSTIIDNKLNLCAAPIL